MIELSSPQDDESASESTDSSSGMDLLNDPDVKQALDKISAERTTPPRPPPPVSTGHLRNNIYIRSFIIS